MSDSQEMSVQEEQQWGLRRQLAQSGPGSLAPDSLQEDVREEWQEVLCGWGLQEDVSLEEGDHLSSPEAPPELLLASAADTSLLADLTFPPEDEEEMEEVECNLCGVEVEDGDGYREHLVEEHNSSHETIEELFDLSLDEQQLEHLCSTHDLEQVAGARRTAQHCTALHCTALHCTALWSRWPAPSAPAP
jgi:hypothetical protein